jgi:CHASE2 domain-containing sensor protein
MPRAAGIGATLLLGLFALDAFDGRSLGQVLPDFAIHLLPAMVCGTVVALAWRRPWIGATVFGLLAAGYALSVPSRPDWIAVISGPLAAVALLFAISPRRTIVAGH